MNKFQRSWLLFKSSLSVMFTHKKLLVFPVVITTFTILIAALFILPVAFQPTGHSYDSSQHWQTVLGKFYDTKALDSNTPGSLSHHRSKASRGQAISGVRPMGVVLFASMYLVSMFCATFFNVAFYNEILKALRGEQVSIMGGISFACTKWKSILFWTMFAGAIGMIIKSLEERVGWVGQLILKFIGTAWSVACVFVIPVIIKEEDASPVHVLKKSALTLKETWGESLIGYAGVSFGGMIFGLLSLVWLGGGIATAIMLKMYWMIALVIVAWVLMSVVASYIMSIASQIFRCALFLYATEGAMPYPYNNDMAELAWKVKKA